MILQVLLVVAAIVALIGGLIYAIADGYGKHRHFIVLNGELYWVGGSNGK